MSTAIEGINFYTIPEIALSRRSILIIESNKSYIILSDPEMVNFMLQIASLASLQTHIEDEKISPYVCYCEASRKYGAGVVKRWHDEGLIIYLHLLAQRSALIE